MPLTEINFRLAYTPENCADFVAAFYHPALAQSVRYGRATYALSAAPPGAAPPPGAWPACSPTAGASAWTGSPTKPDPPSHPKRASTPWTSL